MLESNRSRRSFYSAAVHHPGITPLARSGRKERALDVLRGIGDPQPTETLANIEETLATVQSGEDVPLFQKKYLWPIFLAWAVAMFNQLSGINAINYYAPRIFEQFIGAHAALAATVGLGSVNLFFTFVAPLFHRPLRTPCPADVRRDRHDVDAFPCRVADLARRNACAPIAITAILGFVAFFAVSQGRSSGLHLGNFPERGPGQGTGARQFHTLGDVYAHLLGVPDRGGPFPVERQLCVRFFGCMTLLQFFFAWKLMPETKGAPSNA